MLKIWKINGTNPLYLEICVKLHLKCKFYRYYENGLQLGLRIASRKVFLASIVLHVNIQIILKSFKIYKRLPRLNISVAYHV